MKVTSAYANKLIRGYREELAALISSEKDTCTTIYGASETPIETGYDFSSTQAEMDALNDKIAKLRHGINVFNTTTKLEGFDFTVDESLVRMAMLTEKKNRLSRMKGVRELVRNSVYRSEPEFTKRNYDATLVEAEYQQRSEQGSMVIPAFIMNIADAGKRLLRNKGLLFRFRCSQQFSAHRRRVLLSSVG